jgi:4-amino-4-deoxy-L-arabinose transferase-like glycosyltransferase
MVGGRHRFWLGLLLLAPLIVIGQGHGMWRHDEERDIEIAREMYASNNFAVPTFNGEVFLEKPPLLYASAALLFKLAGRPSAALARVPSTLFAVLGLIAMMLLGRRLGGERAGWWSGLVLVSSPLFFDRVRTFSLDTTLAAFVTLTLYFFDRVYEPGRERYSRWSVLPMYLAAGAAFYTKGFIGLVFPCLAIGGVLAVGRDWRAVWRLRPLYGAAILLALTGPWFYELGRQGGDQYLRIFFLDNHLYRFVQTAHSDLGHHTRWYWYGEIIWKYFAPWCLFLPAAVLLPFTSAGREAVKPGGRRLLLFWFLAGFVFLTASSTKREVYLLPIFPAAALLVALWLEHRAGDAKGPARERAGDWILVLLLAAMAAWLPYAFAVGAPDQSARAVWFWPVALAPAAAAIYALGRGDRRRSYDVSWATGLALAYCALLFYLPVYDRDADASALWERLPGRIEADAKLYSWSPRGMEWGFAGFYLARPVADLDEVADLAALARGSAPVYLVGAVRNPEYPRHVPIYVRGRGARTRLVAAQTLPGGRVNVIWRLVPTAEQRMVDP